MLLWNIFYLILPLVVNGFFFNIVLGEYRKAFSKSADVRTTQIVELIQEVEPEKVLLFTCLILICHHHATIADGEDRPKPTRLPVHCASGLITVGNRQRCLKYEEKPVCYDEAQKKCLEDGGALAEISLSTENIDRVEEQFEVQPKSTINTCGIHLNLSAMLLCVY
ncbi:hypothetical protein DdX_21599 [Ditylenchus destructor]|uniref:C-type lectin domain-containing protein n=1 Tax=Ditylenchus destructor TaxID=166010 RepID=A0AAD4MEP0_9BILA|nr:hypothetical protein DdX_21599 [Ditylenchus destructor]